MVTIRPDRGSGASARASGRTGRALRRRARTLKLLWKLKQERLPGLSERLGKNVRTNSEAILSATTNDVGGIDFSKGVAITSSIHPDEHTHIEPVRYSKGANMMGLLMTLLVDGGGPHAARAPLHRPGAAAPHPLPARDVGVPLVGADDHPSRHADARQQPERRPQARSVRTRLAVVEQGSGAPNPTYIPIANEARDSSPARSTASRRARGPRSSPTSRPPRTSSAARASATAPRRASSILPPRLRSAGSLRRRRRGDLRESRRQPVADDYRDERARGVVLAEPRRGGSPSADR